MRIETLLKKLITFPTISEDQAANRQAITWIKGELRHLPLHVREHRYEGYPSLVVTTRKTTSPTLWLQAHLDVVPGSPRVFMPKVSGRKIYGRGTFDMKFAIATYMELCMDLGKALSAYDFGIMLTTDEEIGGRNGVRALLFEEGYHGKVCFLPDGGSDWKMEQSAKGVLRMSVRSRGKSAHGARPWLGYDANAELTRYLAALQREFAKFDRGNPLHPEPTLTVGILRGGEVINQVPERAEAKLDIRYPQYYPRERIMALLKRVKPKDSRLAIRTLSHSSGYHTDVSGTYHRMYADIVKDVRGRRPGAIDAHGSSDARHFVNAGIPTILIRPRGGGQHSESEWIDLPDLDTYYHALRTFVQQVAKPDTGRHLAKR